jgi:hypothetical protein
MAKRWPRLSGRYGSKENFSARSENPLQVSALVIALGLLN